MPTTNKKLSVVGTTCFKEHRDRCVSCERKTCSHWVSMEEKQNCSVIAAEDGPYTLEKIGQMFNVSRMRICQIEKGIKTKIRESLDL
jgi:hypothetical protein